MHIVQTKLHCAHPNFHNLARTENNAAHTQETVLQPGLRLNCHFDFGKLDSESNASRK